MPTSMYLSSGSVDNPRISSKQSFSAGFLRKDQYSVGCTSNSLYGFYFMYVISSGSVFRALRASSLLTSTRERGINKEGDFFIIFS